MKFISMRSVCAGLFAGSLLGCSGSIASDPAGGGDEDVDDVDVPPDLPPVEELKLNRNPARPLTCTDPRDPVVGRTPFVRLSTIEYANTLRDLLAPLKMTSASSVAADTLRPGFAPDDAFSAGNDLVEGLSKDASVLGALVGTGLDKLGVAGCPPANSAAESACVDAFIDDFVTRAYRRPFRTSFGTRCPMMCS